MKSNDLVMIKWLDAYTSDDEKPEFDDISKHYTVSVGWLVKQDHEFYYISHFLDGIGGSLQSPFTAIPFGMVKEISVLEIKDKHDKKRVSTPIKRGRKTS